MSKVWLGICALLSMFMQWLLEFNGSGEALAIKWFLAFCIFSAAYFVVDHIDHKK